MSLNASFLYFNIFFKSNVYTQFTILIMYNPSLNLAYFGHDKEYRRRTGDISVT